MNAIAEDEDRFVNAREACCFNARATDPDSVVEADRLVVQDGHASGASRAAVGFDDQGDSVHGLSPSEVLGPVLRTGRHVVRL